MKVKQRLFILAVCVACLSLPAYAAKFCQRCYQQKATLFHYCQLNRHLMIAHKDWCLRIFRQAHLLRRAYKDADELIYERPDSHHLIQFYSDYPISLSTVKLPFDTCDACFNDMKLLAFMCQTERLKREIKDCELVQKVDKTISKVILENPAALALPLPLK